MSPKEQILCVDQILDAVAAECISVDIWGDKLCARKTVGTVKVQETAVCRKEAFCHEVRAHGRINAEAIVHIPGTNAIGITDPNPLGRDGVQRFLPADPLKLSLAAFADALHRIAKTLSAHICLTIAAASNAGTQSRISDPAACFQASQAVVLHFRPDGAFPAAVVAASGHYHAELFILNCRSSTAPVILKAKEVSFGVLRNDIRFGVTADGLSYSLGKCQIVRGFRIFPNTVRNADRSVQREK